MKQEKFIAAKRCLEADVLWDVTGRIENITTPIGDEMYEVTGKRTIGIRNGGVYGLFICY